MILMFLSILGISSQVNVVTDQAKRAAYFCSFSYNNDETLKAQGTLHLSVMVPSPDPRKSVSDGIITYDPSNYMKGSEFSDYEYAEKENSAEASFRNDGGYLMTLYPGDKGGVVYAALGNWRGGKDLYIGKCSVQIIEERWFREVASRIASK